MRRFAPNRAGSGVALEGAGGAAREDRGPTGDGMETGDGVRRRLSGMMAGVYAVHGAWWPLLAVHLQDMRVDGRARGAIFATLAIAALLTPLGAGQVADRLMPMQRLMALIYALGTGLLMLIGSGWVRGAGPLFLLFLAYWLLTAPGLGLSSALAFRNLDRPADQFGGVRLWGTVGWMVVGWVVSIAMAVHGTTRAGQGAYEAFWVAAVVSASLSAYCLTLPHTPPLRGVGAEPGPRRGIDLGEVRELAGRPSVGVLLALAFGVSLTTPFVYQVVPAHLAARGLPRAWIGAAMSLGQVLEILGLTLLPRLLGAWGHRGTLAVGIAAWVGYYGLLALRLPLPLGLVGLPIQGLAIAFFHIVGPMFLDRRAPAHLRGSAQGLYLMATTGFGVLLGSLLAGEAVARAGGASASVFLVPLAIDAAMLATLLVAFRPGSAGGEADPRPALDLLRSHAPAARARTLAPGRGEGE